jgi:hypothetical protein
MNEKVADILRQVRELSEKERAALIEALAEDEACAFASPEIAKAWEEEIERRIDAIDRGEMPVRDVSEVTYESLIK